MLQNSCIHQNSTVLWTKKKHTTPPKYSHIHLFSVLNLSIQSSLLKFTIAVSIFTPNLHLPIEKHFWFQCVGCGLSQEPPTSKTLICALKCFHHRTPLPPQSKKNNFFSSPDVRISWVYPLNYMHSEKHSHCKMKVGFMYSSWWLFLWWSWVTARLKNWWSILIFTII